MELVPRKSRERLANPTEAIWSRDGNNWRNKAGPCGMIGMVNTELFARDGKAGAKRCQFPCCGNARIWPAMISSLSRRDSLPPQQGSSYIYGTSGNSFGRVMEW